MSGQPIQQYVPQAPYGPPQRPPEKKGTPTAVIVVIIIVIMVLLAIGFFAFMVFMVGDIAGGGWEDTRTFSTDVLIEDGGHFRYLLSANWEDELIVNLSLRQLNGSRYDVYIMDDNQYENAYGNSSTGAFSTLLKWQNVSTFADSASLEDPGGPIWLVIDNEHMPHVPGNAVPQGPIHVEVDLEITSRYDF